MERWIGLLGIVALFGLVWLMSTNRRAIPWRIVVVGVILQLALAWLLLTVGPVVRALDGLAWAVNGVIASAGEGSKFVFGDLADLEGPWGFIFVVQAVPVIIFFGALMGVLYHMGVMQRVVAALAWCLQRTLGVSGTEALSVAANVFVGQTEAPLMVRPYLVGMTRSQLTVLMTGGFATIAGSVLGAYVILLGGDNEATRIVFAKHLMVASVLSAPAAIVMAKIIVPETETPPDEEHLNATVAKETRNVVDAAAVGTTDGLRLAMNVVAMLVSFIALLALINWPLEALSEWRPLAEWRAERQLEPFSVQMGLGYLLSPLALLMGVPWEDCRLFGSLLGEKIVVTELLAFGSLSEMIQADEPPISPRTSYIAAYALCGFANLPSIGIQIGGISALAPERRADLARLGLRAMIAGACASWCTACVAGLFLAS
ncbi:MAG: NupC/NupG family nucleoside CNT transporter [Planctomycetota bacterium]|jgi:CNT family concentrative nucleoside transporter